MSNVQLLYWNFSSWLLLKENESFVKVVKPAFAQYHIQNWLSWMNTYVYGCSFFLSIFLFVTPIALSGQASGFFGIAQPGSPSESAKTLARTVGCIRYNDSFDMIDCLRDVDAEEVDFWGFVGTVLFRRQLPNMIPVIDGDFVPQHPELSWRDGWCIWSSLLTLQ